MPPRPLRLLIENAVANTSQRRRAYQAMLHGIARKSYQKSFTSQIGARTTEPKQPGEPKPPQSTPKLQPLTPLKPLPGLKPSHGIPDASDYEAARRWTPG